MRKLLKLDRAPALCRTGYEEVTGSVISPARRPSGSRSGSTIDQGSGDGVQVDDPVVSGDGLVGKVTSVTGGRPR